MVANFSRFDSWVLCQTNQKQMRSNSKSPFQRYSYRYQTTVTTPTAQWQILNVKWSPSRRPVEPFYECRRGEGATECARAREGRINYGRTLGPLRQYQVGLPVVTRVCEWIAVRMCWWTNTKAPYLLSASMCIAHAVRDKGRCTWNANENIVMIHCCEHKKKTTCCCSH